MKATNQGCIQHGHQQTDEDNRLMLVRAIKIGKSLQTESQPTTGNQFTQRNYSGNKPAATWPAGNRLLLVKVGNDGKPCSIKVNQWPKQIITPYWKLQPI